MKKRISYILILLLNALIIFGCSARNGNNSEAEAPINEATSVTPALQDNNPNRKQQCTELIIQRKTDYIIFQYDQIKDQGILLDIEDLLWIVPRGGLCRNMEDGLQKKLIFY